MSDVRADAANGIGLPSSQYIQSTKNAQLLQQAIERTGGTLSFTGHS